MEILAMLEREEFSKETPRLRFRSYQPVIRGLFQRGDIEGVLKLWKHMQWHKILPKVLVRSRNGGVLSWDSGIQWRDYLERAELVLPRVSKSLSTLMALHLALIALRLS